MARTKNHKSKRQLPATATMKSAPTNRGVNPEPVALSEIHCYTSPSPKYDSMPKEVALTSATEVDNPGIDSIPKEDNSHSHECPRPNKRSHTEALAIYGQCFQITKSSSGSSLSCSLHKKNIHFANVVLGETVQVVRCRVSDDRCYNELNLVAVESLQRNRDGHVPVNCIDVNNPLKYKCFLCDNSNLTSHFDKARLHLIECHPRECWPGWLVPGTKCKSNNNAYILRLKRFLLDHGQSQSEEKKKYDLAKLRQKSGEENERFKVECFEKFEKNIHFLILC
jgi:hypothetical protein